MANPIGAIRQWWPSDMVGAFGDVNVNIFNDQFTIAITKYRNASHKDIDSGTQEGRELKLALMKAVPDINNRIGFNAFRDVWDGKSSPWAIAEVFSTMNEFSDELLAQCDRNPTTFLKWTAAQIRDPSITWQQTYQRIADRAMGLDCNGFAGNWVRLCDAHVRLGPSMDLTRMGPHLKQTRYARSEFRPGDVLMWGTAHIAVLDSRSTNGKFWVCQSNGRGPNTTEYSFEFLAYAPDGKTPQYRLAPYVKGDVGGGCTVYSLWTDGNEPLQEPVPFID